MRATSADSSRLINTILAHSSTAASSTLLHCIIVQPFVTIGHILFYFDSFKNTTRRSLELPTISRLLSFVAMKKFVWLIGVFGFDWDREWHQHHGSW
jgi:hypothetical protein